MRYQSLNKFCFVILSCFFYCNLLGQTTNLDLKSFDVVIIGGTPAGIMAAISADREGKTSIILERSNHLGGLPANGLGATDLETRGAVGGLFKVFINRIENHYKNTYGRNSPQHIDCDYGYHFEPSVAEKVLLQMISEHPNITVLKNHQFNSKPENVIKLNNKITSIWIQNRNYQSKINIKGSIFIDATYEGDLIAAAGVSYSVGRESKTEYDEPFAGKVYKYWNGPVSEGSTFIGDNAIQAYNYRLCLTSNPKAFVEIEKPKNYNRKDYISLIEDVITGRNADEKYYEYLQSSNHNVEHLRENLHIKPSVPGNNEGIHKLVNMITLPNNKSDANNQHVALISTDLPEENWQWPESDWEWRDAFSERLKEYTLGLLWFSQNDEELPNWFKKKTREWGLDKYEYIDNNYFPRQVYVREGRRMQGLYFYTAHDALPISNESRPPIHKSSISAGHYAIDSHGVRKREENRVHLDGFISYPTKPFTIPYGVIVPKNISNLLSPVPISGTHLGFSALRMEPTWMVFGEAAGIAASLSIDQKKSVQDISIKELQYKLLQNKGVLIFFKDVNPGDFGFEGLEIMALNDIFIGWNANPNKSITQNEVLITQKKLNLQLNYEDFKNLTRSQFADEIFKLCQKKY